MDKVKTSICYCDIARERLAYLVQEHFIRHVPTSELMSRMKTAAEKEEVAVVALLDVPKEELQKILIVDDIQKIPHWEACHEFIRRELAEEGLRLKGM